MSPILRVLLSATLLILLTAAPSIEGSASGKHNQASTGCTCHTNGANGITANHNFPAAYTPGATYGITIDGTGGSQAFVGGFSLQVSLGSFSNAGSLVQISGTSATHSGSGSLSWTMDWIAPAAGSGPVDVDLAVLQANANSLNTGDSWAQTTAIVVETLPPNQPPSASNLMLIPSGDVTSYEMIMFEYDYFDGDSDPESNSQIRWSKNGVLAPTYDDLKELPDSATSVGDTWTVTVTPYDGTDFGVTESCPDSVTIVDVDTDGDGIMDSSDAFPSDITQWADQDGDGYGDNQSGTNPDAFPTDSTQSADQDGDGYGDNQSGTNPDAFPTDSTQSADQDGDGYGDNQSGMNPDAFPFDTNETMDSDDDGTGDNADQFPNDANETTDSDNDSVGDNADVFPQDATETLDSDNDSVGDNADAFPQDATETLDSDNDGVGDNADVFRYDANETLDSDADGVGDNADAFPSDATETLDTDGDGVGDNAQLIATELAADLAAELAADLAAEGATEEDGAQSNMMLIVAVVVLLIGGAAGAVLFMRKRGSDEDASPKEFSDQLIPTQVQPVQQTYQQPVVEQPVQQTYQQPVVEQPVQQTYQQPVVEQPVQQTYQQPVVEQPAVVAEPTVLQQWTDEAGYTWRAMDDGTNFWWTGTEWQLR